MIDEHKQNVESFTAAIKERDNYIARLTSELRKAPPREPTADMIQRGVEDKITVQVYTKSANDLVAKIWCAMWDSYIDSARDPPTEERTRE